MTDGKSVQSLNQSVSLPTGYILHWYEIQSLIGRGAFGMTYLAMDTNLHKQVAIKEYLPRDFAARHTNSTIQPITHEKGNMYKWGLTNFLKEARILARFTHPNIISVVSVFELNNTAYMVMEYEKGDNLSTVLHRQRKLSQKQLLDITIPLLEGLNLVHEAGFVHRDIKPSNIYLRANKSPVLLDFGSARQAINTDNLTSILTQGYSPLEQYENNPSKQGPWTDVYAFGATLYYCISGTRPVDAITRGANLLKGGQDIYKSIFQMNDGTYDANFLAAIDASLRFNIEDRPQNMQIWKELLLGRSSAQGNVNSAFTQTNFHGTIQEKMQEKMDATVTNIDTNWPYNPPTNSNTESRRQNRQTIRSDSESFSSGAHYLDSKLGNPPSTKKSKWQRKVSFVLLLLITIGIAYSTSFVYKNTDDNIPVTSDKNEIYNILAIAQAKFDDAKFLEPINDNALTYYKKALDLDPRNIIAIGGINQIIQFLENEGRRNLAKRNYSKVEETIQKIQDISPGNTLAVQLNIDMQYARSNIKEIENLNKLAQGQFRSRQYADPMNTSAISTYLQVLSIDTNNLAAKRGLNEAFNHFSNVIYEYIESGNYKEADKQYRELASLAPRSKKVAELKSETQKYYKNKFDSYVETGKFDEADEIIVAVKTFDSRSSLPKHLLKQLTSAKQKARTIRTIAVNK